MRGQHQKRRYTPTGEHPGDQRSSSAANAHPSAAGFLTARDTARDTERSARDTARHVPSYHGFESDMHTARGFETDDYLSAVEPNTSRSTDTFAEVRHRCLVVCHDDESPHMSVLIAAKKQYIVAILSLI